MSCVRQAVAKMMRMNSHTVNRLLSPSSSAAPFFSGGDTGRWNPRLWWFLSGNAALFVAINSNTVLAKDASLDEAEGMELRRIEGDSVKFNIHTSKWRVFTDKGREFFLQGKLEEAEKLFLAALQEAKEGFGKRDPHVASASNNLAELYRVNKLYHKAEPLYLEAISILEESFGPEDIRVGSAFHNMGQFYIVQRKLDEARVCYEHALKIKRRVLGLNHTDYADTMYHLGTVLHLQGNEKDSEALVQDSIRILENGGQGESIMCLKRMRYLAQLQASDALGLLEITKKQLQGSKQSERAPNIEAENALFKGVSAYKEFVTERSITESPEMKVEYLKCLKHLLSLNSDGTTERTQQSTEANLQDLRDEIKRLEVELSPHRKHKI